MAQVSYKFVEVDAVDCETLMYTWVEAAAEKNPAHYAYLMNTSGSPRVDCVVRAHELREKMDASKGRYKVAVAMAKPDDKPEANEKCIGYLLGFEQNMFTAEIQQLCSRKTIFGQDLTDQRIGSTLLGMYVKNLRSDGPFATEMLEVNSHPEAVEFWEKMGFEKNGRDMEQGDLLTFGMSLDEDGIAQLRKNGCAPGR